MIKLKCTCCLGSISLKKKELVKRRGKENGHVFCPYCATSLSYDLTLLDDEEYDDNFGCLPLKEKETKCWCLNCNGAPRKDSCFQPVAVSPSRMISNLRKQASDSYERAEKAAQVVDKIWDLLQK